MRASRRTTPPHQEGLSRRRSNLGSMSVSSEVQRTLVKSPPELWAELSNPETLARHLGELGDIRITSSEPETKVEWEADGATGVVHLKQSGWGTRVTLSVTRTAPPSEEQPETQQEQEQGPETESTAEVEAESEPVVEPETVPVESEDAVGPEPIAESKLQTVSVEPEPAEGAETIAEPEPVARAETIAEPEPIVKPETVPTPEPRPGFFARLFRRRKRRSDEVVEVQPEPEAPAEPESAPEIDVVALAMPEPIYPPRPVEPAADLATELASVEAQMEQETTELLTGVLDRLGAAHHRPFSRG